MMTGKQNNKKKTFRESFLNSSGLKTAGALFKKAPVGKFKNRIKPRA